MISNTRTEAITTERLEFRRFRQADKEAYTKMWTKSEFYRYLGDGKGVETGVPEKMVTFYSFNRGMFAVVEKASGKLIGHCGIRPIPDGRIELLYAYDPEFWNKGYGTEAAKAVLEYGKANLEMGELIAMAYPENPGSIGIMKKLGFISIGQEEHFGKTLEVYSMKMK